MAKCKLWQVDCAVGNAVGSAASNAASSAFQNAADSMIQGWNEIQQEFLTSWLHAGLVVNLQAGSVPWLQALLSQFAFLFALAGVLTTALYTVFALRGDRVQQLGARLIRMLIVTAAGTGIFASAVTASDTLADWIVKQAGVTTEGTVITVAATAGIAPGLTLIAAVIAIFGVIIQWGIMLVRGAILPLLIAVWPLSAAASTLRSGEKSFTSITGWLVAFLLYKPAAAIVYAFAFKQQTGVDGLGGILNSMILIVIAILALPSLMRLIVPAAGALGNAVGGAIALGAAAAVVSTGVAVGAAMATGGASAAAGGLGAAAKGMGGAPAGASAAGGGSGAASAAGGSFAPSGSGGGGGGSGPGGPSGSGGGAGSGGSSDSGASSGSGGSGPSGSGSGSGGSGGGSGGSGGGSGASSSSGGGSAGPEGGARHGSGGAGSSAPLAASGAKGASAGSNAGKKELGRQVAQNMPKGSTQGIKDTIGGD